MITSLVTPPFLLFPVHSLNKLWVIKRSTDPSPDLPPTPEAPPWGPFPLILTLHLSSWAYLSKDLRLGRQSKLMSHPGNDPHFSKWPQFSVVSWKMLSTFRITVCPSSLIWVPVMVGRKWGRQYGTHWGGKQPQGLWGFWQEMGPNSLDNCVI